MKHLIPLLPIIAMLGCSQVPAGADLSALLLAPNSTSPSLTQATARRQHPSNVAPRPGDRDRVLASARRFQRQGEYERAIQLYTQWTETFPSDAESLHNLAVLQDKHGDPEKSARSYLQAIHFAPQDADLLCDYGYSRYIQGDYLQAEETLRKAIKLDPTLTRAHTNLGLVLVRQGKDDEAFGVFEKAGLSAGDARENLRQARLAAELSSGPSEVSPGELTEVVHTANQPAYRPPPGDQHVAEGNPHAEEAAAAGSQGPAASTSSASPRMARSSYSWSPVRSATVSAP